MVLEAPRDNSTTIEEEQAPIPTRLRPLPMQAPSDIAEAADSLDVEFPDSNESINIRNEIPALRYDPSTSTLSIGDNTDSIIIQQYENDINNNNQNVSIIDLLENEESMINSSIELQLDQYEFADTMDKQDQLLDILTQNRFTDKYQEKVFKHTQETILNALQNPQEYNLNNQATELIYKMFLNEMLDILKPRNGEIYIEDRYATTLSIKWYYIALLLRSGISSNAEAAMIPALTTYSVSDILTWIHDHDYQRVLNDAILNQARDETARRRREARHIYFRNLNARQNRIQSRIRRNRT